MKNWEVKTLGDIGKVSMCKRVFKEDTLPTGDIPFYKIGTFGKEPNAYITKERYDEFRRKFSFPKKGDILISASGTIGRCVRYDGEPAYFQDSNIVWIDNDEKNVLNSFLYRFYEVCNWGSTKGATIARLYNSNLKQIEIAYPKSLHEQQRIVAILDEVFEAIAKAKANTEQNLKNAKELFDVYLHKFYTSKEEGWEEKKLKEVAEYFNGLTYSPKNVSNEGIIVLRSSNVQNDVLDFKDIVRVNLNVKEKIIVKEGDILMCSRNGSARLVGKTATIKNLNEEMTFGTFMMIVRSQYNPYLSWFFKSTDFRNQIKGGGNTMINQITRYMLDDVVISFPPIEKQNEVVQKLNALHLETKKLEAIYQQKINDLEELKKSVLQKAFAGELKENLKEHFAENA
ncbi:MAG TPA: restriction endonuclease subunit S [Flavobacterium sp.]|nr:restriction endonuclease subunit S [Flavobacterium sp.]